MRSITTLLGTAAVGASLVLAVPAAHAATALPRESAACASAVAAAQKAEADYAAALADYKKIVSGGGHPDASQQAQVTSDENNANALASDAARVCGVTPTPSGSMQTGVGSTSEGTDSTDIALGASLLAAVGAGAFVLRRRRSADQA